MEVYKKLVKNSAIFAVANIGSKLISIILVPLYTYILTTEEYGTIDIIVTTVSLLLPLISLSIYDATLRYSIKSDYDKSSIFTSSMMIILGTNFALIILYPLISKVSFINEYIGYIYILLLLQGINTVFSQFIRGIGYVKAFAFNGILNTFVTVISNIILLVKFNTGIKGYLLSIIISNLVCSVYIFIFCKLWRFIRLEIYNKKLIYELLSYSIPLIPNSLMWWIMNLSDRYIISLFLGVTANGLYAVANKIPSIINVINSVFFQAWQLSAVEESDSDRKSTFYTNVFGVFMSLILIATSLILVFIKPIINMVISEGFAESWEYVPFLLMGTVFSSFSGFLGTNYIAMKKTKGILKSSVIGAIINMILNIILINSIGLNGATIATMLGFLFVWVYRIYDTKKFVTITMDWIKFIKIMGIISIQILILYLNLKMEILISSILFIILLAINKQEISILVSKISLKFES